MMTDDELRIRRIIGEKMGEMMVDLFWIGNHLNNLGLYDDVEETKKALAKLKAAFVELRKKEVL